jgi:hypothetical protein
VVGLGGASGAGVQPEGHHIVREDTWMKCIASVGDRCSRRMVVEGWGRRD